MKERARSGGLLAGLLSGGRHAFSLLGKALALDERRCASCREPFIPQEDGPASAALFCPSCRPAFRWREAGYCPHCGEPSAVEDAPIVPCGDCLQKLPPWDDFLFCGIYEGRLRELILHAKFHGGLDALHALGLLLAERCVAHYSARILPQVVVPLPLHPARLRERGLDQCLEMARPAAKALGIPVRPDLLRRVTASVPQSSLDRAQRRQLLQPFEASSQVRGLRVLLLDDVCTTGATLARASECLLAAGALAVDAVVAARASRHSVPQAGRGRERG